MNQTLFVWRVCKYVNYNKKLYRKNIQHILTYNSLLSILNLISVFWLILSFACGFFSCIVAISYHLCVKSVSWILSYMNYGVTLFHFIIHFVFKAKNELESRKLLWTEFLSTSTSRIFHELTILFFRPIHISNDE